MNDVEAILTDDNILKILIIFSWSLSNDQDLFYVKYKKYCVGIGESPLLAIKDAIRSYHSGFKLYDQVSDLIYRLPEYSSNYYILKHLEQGDLEDGINLLLNLFEQKLNDDDCNIKDYI